MLLDPERVTQSVGDGTQALTLAPSVSIASVFSVRLSVRCKMKQDSALYLIAHVPPPLPPPTAGPVPPTKRTKLASLSLEPSVFGKM